VKRVSKKGLSENNPTPVNWLYDFAARGRLKYKIKYPQKDKQGWN